MEEGYLDGVVWGNQGYVDLRLKDFGAIRDFTECEYSDPRPFSFPCSAWECLSTAPAVRDARASRSSFPRWSVGTIGG